MTKAVELAQVASTGVSEAFKNRIINGAMVINQRNFSGAGGTNGTYTLDRWCVQNNSGASRYTVSQNAGSVTPPAGFVNYLGLTSSGAYSVTSTDVIGIYQQVEGFNWADMNWGSSNAKTATLSFWVRSSITGTYTAAIIEGNVGSVSYPATYTISSANTWEYKTVTIPGPTTGSFQTGNLAAVQVLFNLGTGATFLGTPNVWGSGSYAATGQTNWVGTNGATFYITGVQLEVGSSATSFEYRSYGTELALCQRYTYIISGTSTFSNGFSRYMTFGTGSTGSLWFPTFPVQMRTPPSLLTKNFNGSFVDFYNYNTTVTPGFSSVTIAEGDVWHAQVGINFSSGSGLTNLVSWRWSGNPDAYIGFSAEL